MLGEVLGNMPNIVVNTITIHHVLVSIFLSHFLSHSLSVAQNMLNIQVVKKVQWCCQRDSNTRPHPYQGCALPLELWQHCGEFYNRGQWFARRIEPLRTLLFQPYYRRLAGVFLPVRGVFCMHSGVRAAPLGTSPDATERQMRLKDSILCRQVISSILRREHRVGI